MSASVALPIFIVGSPRSGTSVLTWCLGRHSNIILLPETNWLGPLASTLPDLHARGSVHGKYSHLSAHNIPLTMFGRALGNGIDDLVRTGFENRWGSARKNLRTKTPDETDHPYRLLTHPDDPKKRWVDGTPFNAFFLRQLILLFPQAKILHLIRSPDKVISSLIHFDQAGGRSYRPREAARIWLAHTQACLYAETLLPQEQLTRVFYDDLVNDPQSTLSGILSFVGEHFEADCLEPLSVKINSSRTDRVTTQDPPRWARGTLYRRCLDLFHGTLDNGWKITSEFAKAEHNLASLERANSPPPRGVSGCVSYGVQKLFSKYF